MMMMTTMTVGSEVTILVICFFCLSGFFLPQIHGFAGWMMLGGGGSSLKHRVLSLAQAAILVDSPVNFRTFRDFQIYPPPGNGKSTIIQDVFPTKNGGFSVVRSFFLSIHIESY